MCQSERILTQFALKNPIKSQKKATTYILAYWHHHANGYFKSNLINWPENSAEN